VTETLDGSTIEHAKVPSAIDVVGGIINSSLPPAFTALIVDERIESVVVSLIVVTKLRTWTLDKVAALVVGVTSIQASKASIKASTVALFFAILNSK